MFLVCISLFAQNSLGETLKYYPLHSGDYWEYQVTKWTDNPGYTEKRVSTKWIERNTVLEINKNIF